MNVYSILPRLPVLFKMMMMMMMAVTDKGMYSFMRTAREESGLKNCESNLITPNKRTERM